MISNSGLTNIFVRIGGEHALLSMAQSNLLSNIERIATTRTHTFLSNNAQNEVGVSRNFGSDRYYSWDDTVIDCTNAPNIAESKLAQSFADNLSENNRFQKFKEKIESRMGGFVRAEPFAVLVKGEDNMRYNIKRESKIDDFDMIRVGFRLMAENEADFKSGLAYLKDLDNPLKMKRHIMEYAQPFNA